MGQLLEGIEAGVAAVESRIEDAAIRGIGALDGVAAGNSEQTTSQSTGYSSAFSNLVSGADAAFMEQGDAYAAQTQAAASAGVSGFAQVTAGFQQASTTTTSSVAAALTDSAQRLEEQLRESLAGIDSPSTGIPSRRAKRRPTSSPRGRASSRCCSSSRSS